jgi:diaminohydroxyphosphoribosylaminopyrimidine deaminase/5-amino-6-(5-phosphoribosylamino)uracil reductase
MNAVTERIPIAEALPPEPPPVDSPGWQAVLARRWGEAAQPWQRAPSSSEVCTDEAALRALYDPLCSVRVDQGFAIGHLAQSLDGRIATLGGVSRWLSGDEDLLHTHRMRALADAVVVGVSTVRYDNPQLTVRRCTGPHPVRVVIDPEFRLDGSQRVFTDPVAPTLLIVAADRAAGRTRLGHAEVLAIERSPAGDLSPAAIRRALIDRGLRWLFIEGGGTTVSRFLKAGVLERLQLTIAPVILGSGRPAIELPAIEDLRDSLRPATRQFRLGVDTMVECVFRD